MNNIKNMENANLEVFEVFEEEKSYENNDECCEGCICGDTIELLKTTETAWILTKIDSEGEYKYIKDSFINFHGTGKNQFAFFNNDKEIKGEFTINKNNHLLNLADGFFLSIEDRIFSIF